MGDTWRSEVHALAVYDAFVSLLRDHHLDQKVQLVKKERQTEVSSLWEFTYEGYWRLSSEEIAILQTFKNTHAPEFDITPVFNTALEPSDPRSKQKPYPIYMVVWIYFREE